jgi:tape measure domain-containing protein
MSVVANIAVNLDARDAARQLSDLDGSVGRLSSSSGGLQKAFGGLSTAIAGLGLGALMKDLTGSGIDADRTSKRIKNLADANNETAQVFGLASKAAKDFGLSNLEAQKGVADLYGRLRPAGVGLKDIETVFNGVNKAALAAGLSSADTSGVFLQLSQALGSGVLQGDEFRSIMERMPAVGQAAAKVLGVTVGQLKEMSSAGKITTEVMIQAAAELDKLTPPPPDAFKQFNAAMEDLRVELGENILPLLTPFVKGLLEVVKAFSAMPEPLQTAVVGLGLLVTGILTIGSAAAFLAPVIGAFKTLAIAIGAANLGGLIAGWLPVIASTFAGIVGVIKGAGAIILAVFSGPVGWTVLAVAAVVAMAIAFREPLQKFFSWLGTWGKPISNFFKNLWNGIVNFAKNAFDSLIKSVRGLWDGIINGLRAGIRSALNAIASQINTVTGLVNRLISSFNRLPGAKIPMIPQISVPSFADGGMVRRPTLAMVGDGGEPEYMVPESKATQFAQEWLASTQGGSSGGNTPQINITTGPVLEFDGKRYVSMEDLERAMRVTAEGVIGRLRTPSARIALGAR